MDYFISIAGERTGPFSQFQIIERIREGLLQGAELAWHKGAEEWQPLKTLEEFSTYWPLTAEQIARADEARRLARVALDTPQPWLRFWGRMLDYIWFVFVLSFVAGFFLPPPEVVIEWSRHSGGWSFLVSSVWPLLFVPLEAWCLSRYGTTPGKALLQIQVRNHEGGLPSFQQALTRSLLVYLKGLGLALWIVPLFTMSYSRMVLIQTGATSWDRECQTRVEHGEPEMWRFVIVAGVMLAMGFFVVLALLLTSHQFMEALRSSLPK